MCKKTVLYFGNDSAAFEGMFSITSFRGEISSEKVTFHLSIPKIDGVIVDSTDSKLIHQVFDIFKNFKAPILIWTSPSLYEALNDILVSKDICPLLTHAPAIDKVSFLRRQLEIPPSYDFGVFFSK